MSHIVLNNRIFVADSPYMYTHAYISAQSVSRILDIEHIEHIEIFDTLLIKGYVIAIA